MPARRKKKNAVSDSEALPPQSPDPIFDAITFDTNIFYANHKRLDRGLLAELDQYKDKPVQVVISEVVTQEILKYLSDEVSKTHADLRKALRVGSDRGHLDEDAIEALQEIERSLELPSDVAEHQLDYFIDACGAEVVSVDGVSMSQILRAYFSGAAPFSGEGKKHEFPDALIVASLTRWAEQNEANLLAVSKDKGWEEAAMAHERVTVENDLGSAMKRLLAQDDRQQLRRAEQEAAALWAAILAGDDDYSEDATDRLREALEVVDVDYEYESSLNVEIDLPEVSLKTVAWDDSKLPEVVNVTPEGFAFRADARLTVRAHSTAQFSVVDSMDKDLVPLGSAEVGVTRTEKVALLFDVSVEFEEGDDGRVCRVPRIDKIDLLHFSPSFDFGHLEVTDIPDWHDEEPNGRR